MPLTFYPHPDDVNKGSHEERIEVMMDAAERYKAHVLDAAPKEEALVSGEGANDRRMSPREQTIVFNWEAIAILLRELRELPEGSQADKLKKGGLLKKLAEVYEVLRAAKMSKLEAVRLALISESNQLTGGTSQNA